MFIFTSLKWVQLDLYNGNRPLRLNKLIGHAKNLAIEISQPTCIHYTEPPIVVCPSCLRILRWIVLHKSFDRDASGLDEHAKKLLRSDSNCSCVRSAPDSSISFVLLCFMSSPVNYAWSFVNINRILQTDPTCLDALSSRPRHNVPLDLGCLSSHALLTQYWITQISRFLKYCGVPRKKSFPHSVLRFNLIIIMMFRE